MTRSVLRGLWGIIGVLLVIFGIIFYAWQIEPSLLHTVQYEIMTSRTKPVKIAFFTDTHFGEQYSPDYLARIVEEINAQEVDAVLFGGDFFDSYWRDASQIDSAQMAEQLSAMKAPHKYAVWGNHDIGGGAERVYAQLMEASGFTLLKNETAEIESLSLRIVGIDDWMLGEPDNQLTVPDDEKTNIFLTHEPDDAPWFARNGADLILAGHTHGGQIFVPFLSQKFLPPGGRNYVKGQYDVNGVPLVVSCGIGTTKLPARFLNIPEICVLTLSEQ